MKLKDEAIYRSFNNKKDKHIESPSNTGSTGQSQKGDGLFSKKQKSKHLSYKTIQIHGCDAGEGEIPASNFTSIQLDPSTE